jgi:hypothetical protein
MTHQMATSKVTLACKRLSAMGTIASLDAESGRLLAGELETVYLKFGKDYVDKQFGTMVALLGRDTLLKAAPTYVWTQPSPAAQLLMDVLEEYVVTELKRILGADVAQGYASSASVVKIAGLVTTEIEPTVAEIYTKIKSAFCSQYDEAIEAIDKRIKKPLDTDSPQALAMSIRKRADAYDNRKTLGNEPVTDHEQVRIAFQEFRSISALGIFLTYLTGESLRPGGASPNTLLALADEFEKFANKDPRVKEQLAAGTTREGSGYAALRTKDGAVVSATQNGAKRTTSPSPSRKGQGAQGDVAPSERRNRLIDTLEKTVDELKKSAGPKGFCTFCHKDGHTVESNGGCYAMQKVVRQLESAKRDTKDESPRGRSRGGRRGRREGVDGS